MIEMQKILKRIVAKKAKLKKCNLRTRHGREMRLNIEKEKFGN